MKQDSVTKSYVDTLGVLKLTKAGDAMREALSMSANRIADVGDPTNPQDVVTKCYIIQLGIPKFVVTIGVLPTSTSSDVIIYTLPAGKTVANEKITVAGLWVEQESDEWLYSNCGEFNNNWTFTRGPTMLI